MSRSRLLLAVLAAIALAAAGCGGTDEPTPDEYEAELRSTLQELEDAYPDAGADAAGADLPATRAAFTEGAARLERVDAPEELEDEHADLVAGVRGLAASIAKLEEARRLADSDPARAKALLKEFADDPSARQVTEATAALEDAGIDTGA